MLSQIIQKQDQFTQLPNQVPNQQNLIQTTQFSFSYKFNQITSYILLIKILLIFHLVQQTRNQISCGCYTSYYTFTAYDYSTVTSCYNCEPTNCYLSWGGCIWDLYYSYCQPMNYCWQYCLPYCQQCNDYGMGLVCDYCDYSKGYFVNEVQSCQACSFRYNSLCQYCDRYSCTSCQWTYYVDSSSNCNACNSRFPNCRACQQAYCYYCQSGYYMNYSNYPQTCDSCTGIFGPQCTYCNYYNCFTCSSPYYSDFSYRCTLCSASFGPGCQGCDKYSGCTYCPFPYYLDFANNCICASNPDRVFINNTCYSCDQLYGAQCLTCDATTCLTCSSPFVINTTGWCFACYNKYDPNCLTCDNSSCLTCQSPYLVSSTNTCFLCNQTFGVQCTTCTITTCTNCISPFMINTTGWCFACYDKYDPNCITCDNTSCLSCQSPYLVSSTNTCFLCNQTFGVQCTTCTSTTCTNCISPFMINTTGWCFACYDKYDPNCITCDNTSCLSCQSPYLVSSDNITCFLCNQTFGVQCSACTNTACTNCISPFVLNTTGWCFACYDKFDPNCLTCSNTTCLSCQPPYEIYLNGTCFLCNVTYNIQCLTCNSSSCITCDISLQYYFVNSSGVCSTCGDTYGPQCLTCNPNQCLTCSSPYVRNLTAPNKICILCTLFKSITCVDGPKCSSCLDGYYCSSSSFQCLPCLYPCLTCNSTATQCLSCVNTSLSFYYNNSSYSCLPCSTILSNCSTCDQNGTLCYSCQTSFTFLNSTASACVTCLSPCLQCSNQTHCLSCLNNSYIYEPSLYQCIACSFYMTDCLQCLNPSFCLACDTGNNSYLRYPQNGCISCSIANPHCMTCNQSTTGPICMSCQIGYYLNTNKCYPCSYGCGSCTSWTNCTSCIDTRYILSGQTCVTCNQVITNCILCNNSTGNMCTKCTNGTVKNTNGSCIACPINKYPDEIVQLCYLCESPCLSCSSLYDCTSCVTYYQLDPLTKRCKDICGDSIVISFQCDNGNGIGYDGCNDECQRQPDWNCSIITDIINGTLFNRSICSYDKNVSIQLFAMEKQPFENVMTWTYIIKPYLYGLPGTTSRQYTFDQLKHTFVFYDIMSGPVYSSYIPVGIGSGPDIKILEVNVDAGSSKISIKFSYQEQIKYSNFDLFVNISYLKWDLGIPNFNTTEDSNYMILVASYLSDSMIGRFYTQQQYAQGKNIYYGGLIIVVFSLIAFIVGIFTKQLVGLQMIMLCQFTYISLFYYKGTLQLPFYALKSLLYSTGLNIPWAYKFYTPLSTNPPQSVQLELDARILVNNFNLMVLLYILPLIIAIPFIPLKAKCVRKLSLIEMGHKWVDLLIGQILLYLVLFNYQYFLFNVLTYFSDGRQVGDYGSAMIIFIGGLLSILSFIGLLVKPQLYGNFRSCFKYNTQQRTQIVEQKQKQKQQQQKIIAKFKNERKLQIFKRFYKKFRLFVNDNYFWKNKRQLHKLVTYNHYLFAIIYFTLINIFMSLLSNSDIIVLVFTIIMLVQLILFRPYGSITQKIRAIYFSLCYIIISMIRFSYNLQSQTPSTSSTMPLIILMLLSFALIWTYIRFAYSFYKFFKQETSDRNILVAQVFDNQIENQLDKHLYVQQQAKLIRKLMKRYQRIQLQYNLNDARNQLLYGSITNSSRKLANQENQQSNRALNQKDDKKNQSKINKFSQEIQQTQIAKQLMKSAQQSKNYRDLKQKLQRQIKKRKKMAMKDKVSGQKLLKLLNLDNNSKYHEQFIMSQQQKRRLQQEREDMIKQIKERKKLQQFNKKKESKQKNNENDDQQNNQADNDQKLIEQKYNEQQKVEQAQISQVNEKEQDNYQSVEPKNLEEAQKKIQHQKILMEEHQHFRYKRAMKVLKEQGLDIDMELIKKNYHKI